MKHLDICQPLNNGWFLLGKIHVDMDADWGYPTMDGNPKWKLTQPILLLQ